MGQCASYCSNCLSSQNQNELDLSKKPEVMKYDLLCEPQPDQKRDNGNLNNLNDTQEEDRVVNPGGEQLIKGMNRRQLDQMDKDVLNEMNKVRQNPKSLIPHLKDILKKFEGTRIKIGERKYMLTKEGPAAVEETIEYLEKIHQCVPLKWKNELMLACRDHNKDLGPRGGSGHDGSDGSKPADRISRYGKILFTSGENISFGPSTGLDVVCSLIVDDGVPNRGHRHNIFNNEFKTVGIHTDYHAGYEIMTTMDFAGGIAPLGTDPIKDQVQDFLQLEHPDFQDIPNFTSCQTYSSIKQEGMKLVKTVTKKYKLRDGKLEEKVQTYTRDLIIEY